MQSRTAASELDNYNLKTTLKKNPEQAAFVIEAPLHSRKAAAERFQEPKMTLQVDDRSDAKTSSAHCHLRPTQ